MEKINLGDYERNLEIRPITLDDYEEIVELQKACFPGMQPWRREHLESQVKIFPRGQLCVVIDGNIVASSSSLILDFDPRIQWHDYMKVADNGFIRNHNPRGDTLYGIEIMVHPDYRGMRLSRRLYEARKELCREMNLASMIIGGRIPGYAKVADQMSARDYVERVQEKALFDPVLTAQLANGFALQGLIDNYLPSDTDSHGYATFLEWRNLDYRPDAKRRYHSPTEPIRLCVVQYQMRSVKSFDEFAAQCEFFMDTAADYHSDFVVFPELFTTQLLSCVPSDRPGLAARQLAEFTPQYLDFFSDAAIRYNLNVVGGSQFVIEGPDLYNVSYLFQRDGTIGKQYKLHITPSERRWWGVQPGSQVQVFETDCGPVSIQICYDIEFPEATRVAAKKGASIVFVPFNTDTRHGYLRVRHCAMARCIENHLYIAVSGCTGNLPFVENADIHYAQSGIFTPASEEFARDAIAAECSANVETLVIHDVDLEVLRRHKSSGSVQNWNDRRSDLYKIQFGHGDERIEV